MFYTHKPSDLQGLFKKYNYSFSRMQSCLVVEGASLEGVTWRLNIVINFEKLAFTSNHLLDALTLHHRNAFGLLGKSQDEHRLTLFNQSTIFNIPE